MTDNAGETIENSEAAFNRAALIESVRGKMTLLHRIIDVFMQEHNELVGDVGQAIQNGDASSLERSAHKLNGTLIAMTAALASESAHKLELMGRSGDLAEATAVYEQLVARVEKLRRELDAMVAEGSST